MKERRITKECATTTNPVLKAETVTTSIHNFDPVLERGQDYASRLQKICDRVKGSGPSESSGGNYVDTDASTIITEIQLRRERLVDIFDWIERSLEQLEGSI